MAPPGWIEQPLPPYQDGALPLDDRGWWRAPSSAKRAAIAQSDCDPMAESGDPASQTYWSQPGSSRRCRSPSACALHSGSGRGREPSRLTALEWRTTVVLIHKPLSSSNPLPTGAGAPVRSIVLEIGTPGQIRTDNLRVLSATPLPNWATGAGWCSRSDSNAHWTGSRPVSSAGWDTRAGAAPGIRTQTGPV